MAKMRLPGGSEIPIQTLPDALQTEIDRLSVEAMRNRSERLEAFCRALAVNVPNPLDYELVEEWGEGRIRWYFQRRARAIRVEGEPTL